MINTLNIEAKKRIFLNRQNKSVSKNEKCPCQFTIDQLKDEIDTSLNNIENGQILSQEQLEKEVALW
jgi:hypothetical protein